MTKGKLLAVAVVMALMGVTSVYGIPAFPGAEGGGATSIGGRGGQILEVTSLSASGAGTLRELIDQPFPRIIVFRVSGTIDQGGQLEIHNPYVTIAGQTAPGGGILIKKGIIQVYTHDVVVRYLTIRRDGATDCLDILDGASKVMVDHCSMSWAGDENTSIWSGSNPAHKTSHQWNIVAEGKHGIDFPSSSSHSCGSLVGSNTNVEGMTQICFHHNLYMSNNHRNPNTKNHDARIVNNIIYNWRDMASQCAGGIEVDYVGNYYKPGPEYVHSTRPHEIHHRFPYSSGNPDGGCEGDASIYIQGNMGPHNGYDPNADNWPMMMQCQLWSPLGYPPDRATVERLTPLTYDTYPITVHDAEDLEDILLPEVGNSHGLDETGSWYPRRDAVDQRLISEYQAGEGEIPIEIYEDDFPTIASGTPYADADHDGMADVWEGMYGFSSSDYNDNDDDADGDGYTNVEEFLNGTDPLVPESGTTPDTQAPSVPQAVTANGISETEIALSWTASTDDSGVSGYHIHRDGSEVGTAFSTAYTDSGLASATAFTYTVSAYDASSNESGESSPAVGTTLAPDTQAPSVPTGLAVDSVTASMVALSWTDSTDDQGVTGYRVFRDGGSIGTVSGAAYTDGGLACCTSYSYSVSAFDAASNESSACTPATADTPGESQSTDLSGDGNVDIADLAVLATNWLGTGCGVTGDLLLDQAVNLSDFDVLAGDWGAVSVDNLIENGSFESGVDVWGNPAGPAAGNGSVDTTVARTGSASFKAVGGSEYAYLDQTPTLTPSTSYTMSCWIKVDAVDGGNARCRPVQLDPTTIQYWGTPISGTSDWTKSEVTFTTESDYAGGRVDLLWDHDTGTAWFDDAILVEN